MSVQYLVFSLNNVYFAINIDRIVEIINYQEVYKVPNTPNYIQGILNLRGRVYTSINLKDILNMEALDNSKPQISEKSEISKISDENNEFSLNGESDYVESKFLLLDVNSIKVAFTVDSADEIAKIYPEELNSDFMTKLNKSYISHTVKIKDREIFILDFEKIVSNEKGILSAS